MDDELNIRYISTYLKNKTKSDPSRFKKVDENFHIVPVCSYLESTTLPANKTLTDRRSLSGLKRKIQLGKKSCNRRRGTRNGKA